jgi:signal transduction histidine kinase
VKRHLLLVYWFVLLVSTLAIGGVAFFLLQQENESLHQLAEDSARNRGRMIVDRLGQVVSGIKKDTLDTLGSFSDAGLEVQMNAWKSTNPYLRDVFVYRQDSGGLVLPLAHTPEQTELDMLLRANNGWLWGSEFLPRRVRTVQQLVAQQGLMIANAQMQSSGQDAASAPPAAVENAGGKDNQLKDLLARLRQEAASGLSILPNDDTNPGGNDNMTVKYSSVSTFSVGTTNDNGLVESQSVVINSSNIGNDQNSVESINLQDIPSNSPLSMLVSNITAMPAGEVITVSPGLLTVTESVAPAKPRQAWMNIDGVEGPRWVGWLQPQPDGPVRGVVLSWAALLEPMRSAFDEHLEAGEGFVLRNPAGQPVISRFSSDKLTLDGVSKSVDGPRVPPAEPPLAWLAGGRELPGWTLAVYFDPAANFSSSFMLVSTVLVGILILSGLVGGTLLLREAKREAYDAARRTSFVSNVSHELKTPLTTIRMYAELLGEGRVRDPAKQRSYLTTIIGESQRLTRLVNNVLDFGRLEHGHKQYRHDDLALGSLVAEVIEGQRPRLEEAGFVCETDLPEDDAVHVRADADALEQVLINLLDNALKYAASGRWVGVRVSAQDGLAVLKVSDHGKGVPAAHRERIFEMFHRVDDSITASQPGSGLGLSIARRLLRDQGGDLKYEADPSGGACFVATLPLAKTTAPRALADATA